MSNGAREALKRDPVIQQEIRDALVMELARLAHNAHNSLYGTNYKFDPDCPHITQRWIGGSMYRCTRCGAIV